MPIYHYFAQKQIKAGEMLQMDGIAVLQNPIRTKEDYDLLKKGIVDSVEIKIDWSSTITVCSLTRLDNQ